MLTSIASRFTRIGKLLPVAALALGLGSLSSPAALAQHSHGGGGGGGLHGGGGGWHGGGWHGGWGGWHGGWGWRGGWGWGGWGWPGWGWGWGLGAYDPFWYGYGYPYSYAPDYPPPGANPDYYGPPPGANSDYYGPSQGSGAAPSNGRGGIYTWNLGIQSGQCNRGYVAGAAGPSPASMSSGGSLGGIVVSPVIGGTVGRRLDLSDQACATAALELGQPNSVISWTTASGIPISIRPTRNYSESDGSPCRDFVATARFASQAQSIRGSACRNNQTGGWEPVG